jgi:hypothetical protein
MRTSLTLLACLMLQTAGLAQHKNPPTDARPANKNQAAIRQLYDGWAKAFRVHDVDKIMSFYAPGDTLVAYDVVPPL